MKFARFAVIVFLFASTATSQTLPPSVQVRRLARMLESDNAEVRMQTIQHLRRGASPSLDNYYREAIPALIQISASEDRKFTLAATEVLTAFGPSPWGVLQFLAAEDTPLAKSAFGRMLPVEVQAAISQMDQRWPGAQVASRLLPFLHDSKLGVRHGAICCLGMLGEDGRPAVPVLLRILRHGPEADRKQAAWALGMIGSRSKGVLEALAKATTVAKPWAGQALHRLRQAVASRTAPKDALATLRRLLPPENARTLEIVKGGESRLRSRIAPLLKGPSWPRQEAAAMVLRALHHR